MTATHDTDADTVQVVCETAGRVVLVPPGTTILERSATRAST